MFKIGDLVRALKDPYGCEYYIVTNSETVCEVTEIINNYVMDVRPVNTRSTFRVSIECFRLEYVELENK